jgi:hypothetical protein
LEQFARLDLLACLKCIREKLGSPKNMKIGLVHDPYSPISLGSVGGEDNLVELEVSLLEARGHEVKRIMRILDGAKRQLHMVLSPPRDAGSLQ